MTFVSTNCFIFLFFWLLQVSIGLSVFIYKTMSSIPLSNSSNINEQTSNISEKIFETPISTLQEYCRKLGKTPQYDLTALEGKGHQPLFVYRCMVGEISASGQGGSKKQAKHAAAKAVLKVLTADSQCDEEKNEPNQSCNIVSKPHIPMEPDQTNPVGSLQELVVAHGWRLPEYTLASETGPAHKKEFIICCTVESFKECGSGSAKKHAKRLAAAKMYKKIMGLPQDTRDTITSQSREAKSEVTFNELLNSISEKLKKIEISPTDLSESPCKTLFEISQQHNFEVVYRNISCKTLNDDKQCLLELQTQPVSVFSGCGKSFREAHSNAARYALHHISTLTKFGNS